MKNNKLVSLLFVGCLIAGCSEPKPAIPKYSVDFLVKEENLQILKKLRADCQLAQASDQQSPDSIASIENCKNLLVAIEQRKDSFNNPNNTKRLGSTRAFSK